ncbi:MAG: HAD family phosphatase [Oscillospiraceae bacterium]|nr:HAD family phosphatase [Oscillospiraceae bacterium]
MKIRCAIFDFDGTLFDSMYVWDTAAERYLRSLGKDPAPTVREEVRIMSLHQAAEYLKDGYALSLTAEEIVAGINRVVEQAYLHDVQPKAGAAAFLDALKDGGASLCIATATDRYLIEAALRRCHMDSYFDAVFTCSEVGSGKDEPVIYREAMAHFHADREQTLIFEDAIHAVQTAKADRFRVVAVSDPSETRQAELRRISDFYLESYENAEDLRKFASAL